MNISVLQKEDVNIESVSFEKLRCHYLTGRSYTISGTGKNRVTGYRTGVQTDYGDIERSEWIEMIRFLIDKLNDHALYNSIFTEIRKLPWVHTDSDAEFTALQQYVSKKADEQKRKE